MTPERRTFAASRQTPTRLKLITTFANGHRNVKDVASMFEAYEHARLRTCLTNGKIKRLELETEPGSLQALWDISWTDESKARGLEMPR
jgi:hypothetical protein